MTSSQIQIDQGKCNQCGLCATECVSGVIQLREAKVVVVEPAWCNRCSHCVAVCPTGAVLNSGLTGSPDRPIAKDQLNPAAYREIVMSRRSVRWYRPEPPAREEIEDLLDLARFSPTASNTMDVGYIVITDRELIKKIGQDIFRLGFRLTKILGKPWGRPLFWLLQALTGSRTLDTYLARFDLYQQWTTTGRNLITHNAPVLIVIHGPKKGRFTRENCAIAAANITNYAHAKGLGACYIGLISLAMDRSKKLTARLGVPQDRRGYLALTLGRPVHHYRQVPIRPLASVDWR